MMNKIERGPFKVRTSFAQLKIAMEQQFLQGNEAQKIVAKNALDILKNNPKLTEGFDTLEDFNNFLEDVENLISLLFPEALTYNEIKCALHPMSHISFYESKRLKNIKDNSINNFSLSFMSFYDEHSFEPTNYLPYALILNKYYGFDIDFARPTTVSFILKDGSKSKYRATYNGDFLTIKPTDKAIDITPEILDTLLLNTDNYEVWEKYFPKDSWLLEGFAILNLTDTSLDEHIDVFKEHLIGSPVETSFDRINEDICRIFGISNLEIGTTQVKQNFLIKGLNNNVQSLLLYDQDQEEMESMCCSAVQHRLMNDKKMVILPNVEAYDSQNQNNRLRKKLLAQRIKSVAFIPIVIDNEVVSLLEIGAFEKNLINAINIVKLNDILPFIYSFTKRNIVEFNNQINAIIQEECTSIHPAVKWKFEEEAYRFYIDKQRNEQATFREVVFENVIPLYGQIDIAGSSKARNLATQHDLIKLLQESYAILKEITTTQNLPFYEQLLMETKEKLGLVNTTFHTNTEQIISDFFQISLYPVFKYFSKSTFNSERVNKFLSQLDNNKTLYIERKKYDATIDAINRELAKFLDDKEEDAQAIFPHYFQKYKTDGVEHDLYVGQSITKKALYHESVLYNLRLWQMQIMCEMEARYYAIQKKYPFNVEVASLIFAYDTPMSIRYRIDEKKFDVDGAYNVRYEMIKKRIDKVHIKNTNQRLTQPHKLAVVYSNDKLEQEYLSYFKFLQNNGYIGDDIEILELEDLQGAIGMKAIRAKINLNLQAANKVYDLEDMKDFINKSH